MTAYLLSPLATADLSDIGDYTAREWRQAQADRFLHQRMDITTQLASGAAGH